MWSRQWWKLAGKVDNCSTWADCLWRWWHRHRFAGCYQIGSGKLVTSRNCGGTPRRRAEKTPAANILCLAPLYSRHTPESLGKANVVVTQEPPGLLCLVFIKHHTLVYVLHVVFPERRFVLFFLRTALSQKLEGAPLSQGVFACSCCISLACRCL